MNRISSKICLGLLIAIFWPLSAAIADSTHVNDRGDFSEYMLRAVEAIRSDKNRMRQGYDLGGFYTRKLDYGPQKLAITPRKPPKTMCNAAVAQVIIEALNFYYRDSVAEGKPAKYPFDSIPVSEWDKQYPKPYDLRFQLFLLPINEEYKDYIKYRSLKLPSWKRLLDLSSADKGMADAFETLGVGKKISFSELRPGDIVTLNRTYCAGYSAVFLGFLNRNQDVVSSFPQDVERQKDIVGFQYISSQGGAELPGGKFGADGYDIRWAYFDREFCPQVSGHNTNKCKCKTPGNCACSDMKNNRFPEQKTGRHRDCCLFRSGEFGIRAGYVFHPSRWKYEESRAALLSKHEAILKDLEAERKSRR